MKALRALPFLLLAALPLRGETGRPLLVSVDDLPFATGRLHPDPAERERITRALLDVLKKHRVPAVGLVIGGKIEGDRKLLDLWLEAGYELGNHSHGHLNYTRTGAQEYVADVEAGRRELAEAVGARKVRFFRFPFLREGDTEAKLDAMRAYLAGSGQRNLPVTIDTQDWSYEEPWVEARKKGDERALARIGEEYQQALQLEVRTYESLGDELFGRPVPQILLLHANEVGSAQWDRLFTWLKERGYRFAGADEVLADPAFDKPHRYVSHFGSSLWDRLASERGTEKALTEVRELIQTQVEAWNRGDLEAFTSGYAEDAAFLSPSGLTRGRGEVLSRYRKRYPDRKAMGRLSLEPIEMRPAAGTELTALGGARPSRVHGVSVAARWEISYPEEPGKEPASGLTLIVFRRTRDGWEIVQDASM